MSDRFPASIRRHHQQVMSNVMGRLQAGATFNLTPQEYTALSDLAGALNYWAAQSPYLPTNTHSTIARGDYVRREWQASVGVVDVFPFVHPGTPFANGTGTYYMSVAEYGGSPWLRRLSVSDVAGDMDSKFSSDGKQATVYVQPGDFPVGTLLYANILLLEEAPTGAAGSGFSIVWP
jgi:hypothetical protein